MKRRTSRENAFIILFELSFENYDLDELLEISRETEEYATDSYGEKILRSYIDNSFYVDELITENLKKWTLQRLPRTCTAILRLATAEMIYSNEDLDSVIINEAVEIAKKFSSLEDYQFINGVLGTIQRAKPEHTEIVQDEDEQ